MSDIEFEQVIRVVAIGLGIMLLFIGLGNLFSKPVIDVEDPVETVYSVFEWFFDLGGGLIATIIGFGLIVLGVYPEALDLVLSGRLR